MLCAGHRLSYRADFVPTSALRFVLVLAAFLANSGCQTDLPGAPAKPTVTGSVKQALASLPPSADTHLKTAAVAVWMTEHLHRQTYQPEADAAHVLETLSADPLSSALLFTAMLNVLHIESRTHMITGVPGFGWYPLVEVLDTDGDHLWDPFTGRHAPDYDGTPLGFAEALSSATVLGASGTPYQAVPGDLPVPDFSTLSTHPSFIWRTRTASPIIAGVNFGAPGGLTIGTPGNGGGDNTGVGASGEYWPGFAVAGVTSNELGPVVLMHSYALTGLVPGERYKLRLTVAQGKPADLLIMPDGVRLQSRNTAGDETTLRFAAANTAATVNIGTLGSSFVRFNAIRWSRE